MSYEIISIIVLSGSLLAILTIIFRKIPILAELPEISEGRSKENIFLRLKNKVLNLSFFKSFSFEIFLQKILSKIRILTLKTDNQTSNWLQRLRERAQKKKFEENDNYWQDLKNSAQKRKK